MLSARRLPDRESRQPGGGGGVRRGGQSWRSPAVPAESADPDGGSEVPKELLAYAPSPAQHISADPHAKPRLAEKCRRVQLAASTPHAPRQDPAKTPPSQYSSSWRGSSGRQVDGYSPALVAPGAIVRLCPSSSSSSSSSPRTARLRPSM
ncbi:hypothetical protein PAAG_08080 [Paracoccidioides lutzii Pb01]|uniref:Uncharacterized protein n=1 Tax=Paracoccidioides lutzii (strain ATCC MYA-826 / Pb01) TaxID=502779 RepID=C1HBD9_PARBA|nr:hypothetical protein PAAG_08080 [Paracoccidioides lutzii Pb01]EEH37662.2 hypothetical protein PAAG_08080 [Paracoccidioides lutzii Pb01]